MWRYNKIFKSVEKSLPTTMIISLPLFRVVLRQAEQAA